MRLIDADALIDDIKNNLWDWKTVDGITATTVLKQTISDIGNQPTIEERKTGKWVGVTPMVDTLMCSECGYNIIDKEFKTPYCPNCGAKMEGEEDGSNDTDT